MLIFIGYIFQCFINKLKLLHIMKLKCAAMYLPTNLKTKVTHLVAAR